MGGAGNVSSDLYRAAVGGGVPTARISKEVTGYKPARPRFRMRTVETASRKKINPVPLAVTQFDSVWQALENTGVEAVNLELRSGLMLQIRKVFRERNRSQAMAAKQCGVPQPRINELLRAKTSELSIDARVTMLGSLRQRVQFLLETA
jgi:predicted XRE-type DNA-binding protein